MIDEGFYRAKNRLLQILRAMRIYQWVKNTLIFVAPLAAHNLWDPAVMSAAAFFFFAFSLTASGIYIINDLMDLEADRAHPRKRRRPFASGKLPLGYGLFGPILVGLGLVLAWTKTYDAVLLLVLYAMTSISYSIYFKRLALADVFILAALYGMRLLAGGIASGEWISVWLLSFGGFAFLSLGFLKRASELRSLPASEGGILARRGYTTDDLAIIEMMGVASSFVSALVLALYVESGVAKAAYALPLALWWTVPLFIFWKCRLWLATVRGHMHDDPIVYASKDWLSWVIFALMIVAYSLAIAGRPLGGQG